MDIWGKLKKSLSLSDDTSIDVESRRRFLKGAAGLAAIAAIPVGVSGGLRMLDHLERQSLVDSMRSGQVIENMTFLIDRPVVLQNISDSVIRNCRFITSDDFVGDEMIFFGKGSERVVITSCIFESGHFSNGFAGIRFDGINPQARLLG